MLYILRTFLALACLFSATPPLMASMLYIGPADNNAVFWIDQSMPNQNVPSQFQKWGLVFTVPTGETQLSSASFYVSSHPGVASNPASYFMVRLSEWDDTLSKPIGLPLFESEYVFFSTQNNNALDPVWGVQPTNFLVHSSVTPSNKYIFEIVGDGGVGMLTASDYANGGLYLAQDSDTWSQFGNYALRSDILFTVPEPSVYLQFIVGLSLLVFFGNIRRKRQLLTKRR